MCGAVARTYWGGGGEDASIFFCGRLGDSLGKNGSLKFKGCREHFKGAYGLLGTAIPFKCSSYLCTYPYMPRYRSYVLWLSNRHSMYRIKFWVTFILPVVDLGFVAFICGSRNDDVSTRERTIQQDFALFRSLWS